MSLKHFSNISSGGHIVQSSKTVCAILVEDIISVRLPLS